MKPFGLLRWKWLGGVGVLLIGALTVAFVQDQGAGDQGEDQAAPQEQAAASTSSEQPIAFPHDIHAGQDQIPCAYCHFSAERSVDAGIPAVATCVGCHNVIRGTTEAQQAEIQKVLDFNARGEQIPWVRIYKVSDHVHFPHMRHINAGVSCQTCHGQVEEMGVIREVNQPLSMGWCVSCHVEQGARRDCTVCHY